MDEFLYIQNDVMSALMQGTYISILLIIPSAIFGVYMGVLSATLRVYGHPVMKFAWDAYVLLFRGFPLLIQLYIWCFGLPLMGIYLSPYWASVVAFAPLQRGLSVLFEGFSHAVTAAYAKGLFRCNVPMDDPFLFGNPYQNGWDRFHQLLFSLFS